MKTSLHTEEDINNHPEPLPVGLYTVYFKMVAVGPNTLEAAEHLGPRICQIVREQPGYFCLGQDGPTDLREAMHDLVDRFCDAQEASNEPESK